MVALGAFYVISVSYLFLGLVHIGFPNASMAEVIKGILSFLSTVASLCIAYLAYRASQKAAIATENAAESNRLAVAIAEKTLFNAAFERRLSIYKAMWELKSILNRVDQTIGVNRKNPKENYVSKEVIDSLSNLRETIVSGSMVLPEPLKTKISFFYSDITHEISCQELPAVVPDELCPEMDEELIKTIEAWKEKNHERNLELTDLLKELSPYLTAP
ncbi:hypothetical protein DA89_3469 [Vibrio paracholerae]|nr:hypothetical protein DA89_3469 [Vibrio paracholerae]